MINQGCWVKFHIVFSHLFMCIRGYYILYSRGSRGTPSRPGMGATKLPSTAGDTGNQQHWANISGNSRMKTNTMTLPGQSQTEHQFLTLPRGPVGCVWRRNIILCFSLQQQHWMTETNSLAHAGTDSDSYLATLSSTFSFRFSNSNNYPLYSMKPCNCWRLWPTSYETVLYNLMVNKSDL